jgi:pimeloyl-ACP methyl ester carboxylesterase
MSGLRVAVIDGTGEWSDDDYKTSMAHSFCSQIFGQEGSAKYWRGPSNDGFSVRSKAHDVAEWLAGAPLGCKFMLAGYSRGASAAIYAAELLKEKGREVHSLFLFDAVARHIFPGGEVIPSNVLFSRHAKRTDDPSFIAKYEGSINLGGGNPARPWFGHTGVTHIGHGSHKMRTFVGSHGALGGVGWKHVGEDARCQEQVAVWMTKRMTQRGLSVVLKSHAPGG